MVYDFDGVADRSPPRITCPHYEPTDLEAIVMALEIAAINLSPSVESVFTLDQLLDEAASMEIDRASAAIVVKSIKFLEKRGDGLALK